MFWEYKLSLSTGISVLISHAIVQFPLQVQSFIELTYVLFNIGERPAVGAAWEGVSKLNRYCPTHLFCIWKSKENVEQLINDLKELTCSDGVFDLTRMQPRSQRRRSLVGRRASTSGPSSEALPRPSAPVKSLSSKILDKDGLLLLYKDLLPLTGYVARKIRN